jgi:hypothetical protein
MSSGNGHEPAITELGPIMAATRPARVLRLPLAALDRDTLSLVELAAVGRAIGLSPVDINEAFERREAGGWAAVELAQGIAWAIARRVEPALTWEEARTFALEIVGQPPDPTKPPAAKKSARRGRISSSAGTASPGSDPTSSGG